MVGMMLIRVPALIIPQSLWNRCLPKFIMPTWMVFTESELLNTKESTKSFQVSMKRYTIQEMIEGMLRGTYIFQRMNLSEAPSILALSRKAIGNWENEFFSMKTQNGRKKVE
jgi:hypothetical protein